MRATEEEKREKRFELSARLKPREKNEKKFTCISPRTINISEFPILKGYLPDSYDYHVCNFKIISETGDHMNFRATLRMALSTEEEIRLWLKSHTVTWRVDRTDPGKRQKVLFKVDFRCQHKTRPRGIEKIPGRSKNTNCPAKMTVTLLRTTVSRGRQSLSTDPHVPTFPTIVAICSDHNHSICVADALKQHDMEDKTKENLVDLFEAVHSSSSALDVLKYNIKVEDEDDCVFTTADRALCPPLEHCYRCPNYKAYQEKFCSQREHCALCYRDTMPVRKMHTNRPGETTPRDLEMCSCPSSSSGELCKHQAAVILQHRVPNINFLPQTAEMRSKLLYRNTIEDNVALQFWQPLREEAVPSTGTDDVVEVEVTEDDWKEETDLVIVTEDDQQAGDEEEALHRAAVAGFAEMCQELSAIINSDSSFTASAMAAVNTFKKIKNSPSKIIRALHSFGRCTTTSSTSVRSRAIPKTARRAGPAFHARLTAKARRRARLGGGPQIATGYPTKFMTGPDHSYSQSAERVQTTAPHYLVHLVSEDKGHTI